MVGILALITTILYLAIPIGLLILIILGIKALRTYLNAQRNARIIADEIKYTNKEIDEIEAELNQRTDT